VRGRRRWAPVVRRWGGERRWFAGVTFKRVPGLNFERGSHWEIAGTTGNPSEAWEAAEVAGDGGRRRGVSQDDGKQLASTGKRGRGE
jgi:hypothetical protein